MRRKEREYTATYVDKPLGGSSLLTTLTEGNGYTVVPPNTDLKSGTEVSVELFGILEPLLV